MGADAVGFVFAPSPRQVAAQQVYDITRRLPPEILTVGVFRDEHPSRVIDTVHRAGLKGAQLHGHETPSMVADVCEQIRWVIKAVVAGSPDARHANQFGTDLIMVDAPVAGFGQGLRLDSGRRGRRGPAHHPRRRSAPRQRRRSRAHRASLGCRRVLRRGAFARAQGRAEGEGVHREGPRRRPAPPPRARHDALRLGRRRGVRRCR